MSRPRIWKKEVIDEQILSTAFLKSCAVIPHRGTCELPEAGECVGDAGEQDGEDRRTHELPNGFRCVSQG